MRKNTKRRGTPSSAAASNGCCGSERRPAEQQDHDEGRVDPDVDEDHGEQRGRGIRRPFEIGEAEKLHEIGEDAEVRIGHQLPHQRGDRRRGHQRQKQKDRDDVVDAGPLLQKHGDAEPEDELDPDRQHGIFERHPHGVPEFAVGEKVDVVLEPDEAAHHRQVQTVAQQRIIDRGDERNDDADADDERRQAEQIGQKVRPPAPRGSAGAAG